MGNKYGMDSRRILAPSGLTKFLLFSQYVGGGGPKKVDDLLTSPINQFRDYFIRNRIEKLVPLNWNFAPHTLKSEKIIYRTVFKP